MARHRFELTESAGLQRIAAALIFTLAIGNPPPRAARAAETPADLCRAVVDAMRSNREKLGAVALAVHTTTIPNWPDPKKVPRLVSQKVPGGLTLVVRPIRTTTSEAARVLVGTNFFEFASLGQAGDISHAWQFKDGLWREFDGAGRRVQVRRIDQLPENGPIDPSELAALNMKQSVEELVMSDRVTHAERISNATYGAGSIEIQVSPNPLILTFAANARFLPVRASLMANGGGFVWDTTIEYQAIASRDALLLKSAKTIRFPPKVKDPKEQFFFSQGQEIYTVDSFELLNDEAAIGRRTAPTTGWQTVDLTKPNPNMLHTAVLRRLPPSGTRSWLLWGNGALVLLLLAFWLFQFRRQPTT